MINFLKKILFNLFILNFLVLSSSNAQVGIGTNTPSTSAVLELQSTDKGFLPPRMTTAQRSLIATPVEGLVIFNSSNNCLEFFDGINWISGCDGSVVSPFPATYVHCDPQNLTEIVEVTSASGRIWMDRNLGASQVATSSSDAASYGDLYQWGRAAEGHQCRNSQTYNAELLTLGVSNFNTTGNAWDGQFILRDFGSSNWVDPSVNGVDDLWQGVNGVNNPCPNGYRLPSEAEWNTDQLSWSSPNAVGAISSPLKLPMAGYRSRSNGSLGFVGSSGDYWSSTVSSTNAVRLSFGNAAAIMVTYRRALGCSVRCIKH
jgi:uncharacterized protein (TIGR02145 family)